MELSIPFAKTNTHRILMIFIDQAKLEASDWCVGVMHWTDQWSCFSKKILSMGKIVTHKTSYVIDSKSLEDCELICEVEITLMYLWVKTLLWSTSSMRWVITCNIVNFFFLFSRTNPSPLLKTTRRKKMHFISQSLTTFSLLPPMFKKWQCTLLVFYVGYILDDKNTLCNGFFLTGLSVLFRVFK